MMKNLINITLLLVALFLPANVLAQDTKDTGGYYVHVDGIRYIVLLDYPEAIVVRDYSAYTGDIEIPSTINYNGKTYTVTIIDENAFSGYSALTSIILPNTIERINDYAFSNCKGLTNVIIPNSVTEIHNNVFSGCTGLTSVTIPGSVDYIGSNAFSDCTGLKDVYFDNDDPDRIELGSGVFYSSIGYSDRVLYVPSGSEEAFRASSRWQPYFEYITAMGTNPRTNITFADANVKSLCVQNWDTNGDGELNEKEAALATSLYRVFRNNQTITSFEELRFFTGLTEISDEAFAGCSGLTSVTIPNTITAIGYSAFHGCSGLASVTIPNSVTAIGNYAFSGCSSLTGIDIPNSVTTIGYSAFFGCSGMTSINIPNSVTTIGERAFHGCSGLTSVTIPNSVTAIGNSAFAGCSGLTSVTIPNTITTIGYSAFSGCSGMTSINIPNSVTTIGERAFHGCSGLTSVTIPNTLTSIGNSAFSGCSGMTSINIPNSVTTIGNLAFEGCSGLTSVTIPNTLTSIGNRVFYGCSGLTTMSVANGNTVYDSRDNCNAIIETVSNTLISGCKNTVIPNSVTAIGDDAFYTCTGLTSIDIPNSVTTIGNSAFYNCSGLTSIDIPNSVTAIGDRAFYGCLGLTSIDIPNTVTSIGFSAFCCCTGLTSISIGSSVSSIGEYAFVKCSALSSITVNGGNSIYDSRNNCNAIIETISNTLIFGCKNTVIPNSVTTIGSGAFYGCSGLTDIIIPNSVTTIGGDAFSQCTGLTNITIPNSVTTIGDYAFNSCSGLTSITIPNSVNSIGSRAFQGTAWFNSQPDGLVYAGLIAYSYKGTMPAGTSIDIKDGTLGIAGHAFYNCSGMVSISIPNSVCTINRYSFRGCSGLTSITIPDSVTEIGECVFYRCTGLTSILIPNSVTTIGSEAFSNCSGLESVTIPNSVTTIGNSAFSNCTGLTSFTIPNSVVSIGDYAFYRCYGLTDVYCYTTDPFDISVGNDAFNNYSQNYSGRTLHVPAGSALIYQSLSEWGPYFGSIVELGLQINDTTALLNDLIKIPVCLTNSKSILAFQTNIYLPEGFNIATDEDDDYLITPSSRLSSDHIILTNDAPDGSVRVICYTPQSMPIDDKDGPLFYITVKVPVNAIGCYTINLRDTRLTYAEYAEVKLPDTDADIHVTYLPGDVNGSRTVTVTDIVVTAQYVLDMNPSPFIFEAADMNGDGNVTVTDIMLIAYLINHPTMNAPKHMPALMDCNDRMNAESATLEAGETRTVSIKLDNEMDYTAFQMDLTLPEGLTASNFHLTERAGSLALDVNMLGNGKTRALCYSPAAEVIKGHNGALLTFDVTAATAIKGDIAVDGIELVNANCQTVLLDGFAIGVNTTMTSVNELSNAKAVARVDYYNLAGQQIDRPESGVTLVITTFTDGTRTTTKVIK